MFSVFRETSQQLIRGYIPEALTSCQPDSVNMLADDIVNTLSPLRIGISVTVLEPNMRLQVVHASAKFPFGNNFMFCNVTINYFKTGNTGQKGETMEKIKLGSGKELELIVCGILAVNNTVTLKFLPGEDSLDELNTLLTDRTETTKMTLISTGGDELAIYNGYTQLQSIGQELDAVIGYTQDEEQDPVTGKLVTVVLIKPDDTVQRLELAEAQLTDMQMALCEVYELML